MFEEEDNNDTQEQSPPIQPPGVPGVEAPDVEERTTPAEPLAPKEDQQAPASVTATGHPVEGFPREQQGEYLTTSTGQRVPETNISLKAGRRGPVLLQDHHLREKITHFDHERIPERVVHARGAGAHGVFKANGAAEDICSAGVFKEGKETDVFVRFSTVLGSHGSSDTVRDTRGFAVKFYTNEGTWDLVGNNMPIFFIQDGIKFPDIIHAGKPHPDREIPQAQSAHDTFWDFVSLHTEAQHHTIWNMSDRGIPRSYRMMEGFGIHTYQMINDAGQTSLVKFHWKPKLGVHSLIWEEAQITNGVDPDFHRRDLADAIEAGAYPQWDLGLQVFPDTEDEMFRDGMHQSASHTGVAPYHPNSLDGGNPFPATATEGARIDVPVALPESTIVREQPASFDDHFSQARLFYLSLTKTEQEHVAAAYSFELGKCFEENIKVRQLNNLAQIDTDLARTVATNLGLPVPQNAKLADVTPSPALSQIGEEWPIDGRQIGILTTESTSAASVAKLMSAVDAAGMVPLVVGERGGKLGGKDNGIDVSRTYDTARSIEFDAIVIADIPQRYEVDVLLAEAFRHKKAIAVREGVDQVHLDLAAPGVVTVKTLVDAVEQLTPLMKKHRVWDRP